MLEAATLVPVAQPRQARLPIVIKPRVTLVKLAAVRAIVGMDAESVIGLRDNGLLQFVFNIAVNVSPDTREELLFFVPELIAHARGEATRGLTLDGVIAEILGARERLRRSELEIEWTISHMHVLRLIGSGALTETGNRILRASAERFLKARWTGNLSHR